MKRACAAGAFALAVAGVAGETARAALVYSFVAVPQSTSVVEGGQVTVSLFLQESFDAGDTPVLANEGLFGAGVLLRRTGGSSIGVASEADVVAGSSFNDPLGPVVTIDPAGDVTAIVLRNVAESTGAVGTLVGPGVYRVELARMTLSAEQVGLSTFAVIDPPDTEDTFRFNDFNSEYPLDALIAGTSFSIDVTAVPEPGLLGLLGGGVLLARRRAPMASRVRQPVR